MTGRADWNRLTLRRAHPTFALFGAQAPFGPASGERERGAE